MGHLRRAPSGRWEARYRGPDGREHSRRFPTKREAQAFLERTGADQQRGEWRDPQGAKVLTAAWIEAWWATTVNLRPSSKARDEAYIRNHVLPVFGELPLGAITQLDVRAWVAELDARGRAPATVQKAYQTLSKILRGAVDAGLIAQSPCRNVGLPRVGAGGDAVPHAGGGRRSARRPSTPATGRWCYFDAYCGLRLGELAGLRRGAGRPAPPPSPGDRDRRRGQGRADLRAAQDQGRLSEGATPPLRRRRDGRPPGHLWGARPGRPRLRRSRRGRASRANGWRARHWRPAIRAAGLEPLRPHDLRHTAVSLWVAAGASPKQIATWAGHTSVSVVLDRYGHLFPGHEAAVLDRLEDLRPDPGSDRQCPSRPGIAAARGRAAGVFAGRTRSDGSRRAPVMPSDLRLYRGRYWFRTSGLCRVKAALSR